MKNRASVSMENLLGLLRIHIHRGVNLAVRDVSTSDPYVIVRMGKQVIAVFAVFLRQFLVVCCVFAAASWSQGVWFPDFDGISWIILCNQWKPMVFLGERWKLWCRWWVFDLNFLFWLFWVCRFAEVQNKVHSFLDFISKCQNNAQKTEALY